MNFSSRLLLLLLVACQALLAADADSPDTTETKKPSSFFKSIFGRKENTADSTIGSLTPSQLDGGLKQAVEKGLLAAVRTLGKTNGFLTNLNVRIQTPDQLKRVETTLRKLGQDKLVDDFEMTMNRAAEKAVPAGTEALLNTLKGITIKDAADLLTDKSPTAITEYFRKAASSELTQKFLPIVQDATGQAGVTSIYKELLDRAAVSKFSFFTRATPDIDQYVTTKTLDGLFVMIGEEEKRLRENPQARTSELLQKVFGAVQNATAP